MDNVFPTDNVRPAKHLNVNCEYLKQWFSTFLNLRHTSFVKKVWRHTKV